MPRRTRIERERDLRDVAQWYCEGLTQSEIAQALGLTQQQISYDIKALIARWQASAKALIDELKAQELLRINHLERVAWQCFEASKGPLEIRIERVQSAARLASRGKRGGRGSESPAKLIPTFLETRTEPGGPGDMQWLRLVQWCISERCKILGLYAPAKVAPVMPDGDEPYEPLSEASRQAALMAALGQISADLAHSPEQGGDQSQAEI